jgi:hypothetical protein
VKYKASSLSLKPIVTGHRGLLGNLIFLASSLNPVANHFLQTNFSACYRHPTLWERKTNSIAAPDGKGKGRVSGTTAVSRRAGWRHLPSIDAATMLSNF